MINKIKQGFSKIWLLPVGCGCLGIAMIVLAIIAIPMAMGKNSGEMTAGSNGFAGIEPGDSEKQTDSSDPVCNIPSTTNVVEIAKAIVDCNNNGRGSIKYAHRNDVLAGRVNRCGPTHYDCSGFVSTVYKKAGIRLDGGCPTTLGIASRQSTPQLERIATNWEEAKQILKPGDIILYNMGDNPYQPVHTKRSHAVIFYKYENNKWYSLESTTYNGRSGPMIKDNYIYNRRGNLWGVFRAR